MNIIESRPTAPFAIFYRNEIAEGVFACHACGERRHGAFPRVSDIFAIASQHLILCRGALRGRPIEGTAIIDGASYVVVLREGVMIMAVEPVFASGQSAVRVIV